MITYTKDRSCGGFFGSSNFEMHPYILPEFRTWNPGRVANLSEKKSGFLAFQVEKITCNFGNVKVNFVFLRCMQCYTQTRLKII